MTDVEKRLAAVEAENADLKGQLAALQLLLGNKTIPPRREEPPPAVRITHPVPQVSLPTDAECRQLCEIVWQRYPTLRPARSEEEEFVAGFKAALRFVQCHGRRAEPDYERGVGWWVDTARDWISQHRVGGFPISGSVLVVAIIAAGDVPYTNPEESGFAAGLQFGGGGILARDWWKRVLGGAILEPVPSPYPTKAPSPARVQQLAVGWRR
jgi:hypothetical protein